MSKSSWTNKQLETMYQLRDAGTTWSGISKILGNKSGGACERKYSRMNWNQFLNLKGEIGPDSNKQGTWDQQEMIRLHTYLDAEKSYSYIAEKLNRSIGSVERKSQTTNWSAWNAAAFASKETGDDSVDQDEEVVARLVNAMLTVSRHDYLRIRDMRKDDFFERINFDEKDLPSSSSYTAIKDLASQELDASGFGNEESISLGEGTYLVVGDSHGKHTTRKMIDLVKNINDYFDADRIIHVGHMLDDDNAISFKWGNLENLTVLAKGEELKFIHKKRHSHKFSYDIVRSKIYLGGDLTVTNQERISDYVESSIRLLNNRLFSGKTIVNCHRMESVSKACAQEASHYTVSPGAICEPHIIRTIKQIDFQEGKTTKVAYSNSFTKYRRMEEKIQYWEQGILVVHVDKDGNHTVIPCFIKKHKGEYYTSYFDKIISSNGVHEPTKKIFIHADMHAPSHDSGILDIQEQVCKDYEPDVLVNIGDSFDVASLSHHDMNKGIVIFGDYLNEAAKTYYIMKRMAKWAPKIHAIVGNHERFIEDFVKKFPQLNSILDFSFVCDLDELGYEITALKDVLKIDGAKFCHGDMIIYNQTGSKMEKFSKAFGENVFIGHIHYPAMRFGCCSVGFAGLMDQGYNEPEASAWIHGLGLCNQYKGLNFPTTLAIFDHKLVLNDKTYEPIDPDSWDLKDFKARIVYDIDGTQKPNS